MQPLRQLSVRAPSDIIFSHERVQLEEMLLQELARQVGRRIDQLPWISSPIAG